MEGEIPGNAPPRMPQDTPKAAPKIAGVVVITSQAMLNPVKVYLPPENNCDQMPGGIGIFSVRAKKTQKKIPPRQAVRTSFSEGGSRWKKSTIPISSAAAIG